MLAPCVHVSVIFDPVPAAVEPRLTPSVLMSRSHRSVLDEDIFAAAAFDEAVAAPTTISFVVLLHAPAVMVVLLVVLLLTHALPSGKKADDPCCLPHKISCCDDNVIRPRRREVCLFHVPNVYTVIVDRIQH